jgi:hypothetical protein
MAKACCNMTKTDQKENIIASNLLSLASSDWILSDICQVLVKPAYAVVPGLGPKRWHAGVSLL